MLILVDMDNTIADLSGHAKKLLSERFPDVTIKEQTHHYFGLDYPELREDLIRIYLEQGFFLNHEPIPGALEGIKKLQSMGHQIVICTSYIAKSEYCLTEKLGWLSLHAPGLLNKVVFAKDKTQVRGDILIDDKPEITGKFTPHWEHVLYDQPYNQQIDGQRMNWQNVEEFIEFLERSKR